MKSLGFAILVLTMVTALGCSANDTVPIAVCTGVAPLAVRVEVTDSASGLSVADNARGVAKLGVEVDSLRLITPPARLIGGTALGTYQVIIDRPGYREWVRNDVVVSQRNECGSTIPVDLVARLQPAP